MSNPERRTGLNSYLISTLTGKFIYDLAKQTSGQDPAPAPVYLWTPESVVDQLAKIQADNWWAGHLIAVRSRP